MGRHVTVALLFVLLSVVLLLSNAQDDQNSDPISPGPNIAADNDEIEEIYVPLDPHLPVHQAPDEQAEEPQGDAGMRTQLSESYQSQDGALEAVHLEDRGEGQGEDEGAEQEHDAEEEEEEEEEDELALSDARDSHDVTVHKTSGAMGVSKELKRLYDSVRGSAEIAALLAKFPGTTGSPLTRVCLDIYHLKDGLNALATSLALFLTIPRRLARLLARHLPPNSFSADKHRRYDQASRAEGCGWHQH
jgi:hypothetical protein